MNDVSKNFSSSQWPKIFDPINPAFPIPQKLKDVARAFVDLQQARHEADYDLSKKFTRSDVATFVGMAQQAFDDWDDIRKTDLARIYLCSFLLTDKWNKTR